MPDDEYYNDEDEFDDEDEDGNEDEPEEGEDLLKKFTGFSLRE